MPLCVVPGCNKNGVYLFTKDTAWKKLCDVKNILRPLLRGYVQKISTNLITLELLHIEVFKIHSVSNMEEGPVKTSRIHVPAPSEDQQAQLATPPSTPDVELIVDGFGFMPKTRPPSEASLKEEESRSRTCSDSNNIDIVRRYTWKTKNRMTVQVISYGATITSIQVPDRKGVPDDVIAGFDTLEGYMNERNPYMGATIGRCAGMIRDATMVVRPSGKEHILSANKGDHHYNGGYVGFDKVNWYSYKKGNKVIMSHLSERFHEGYPGALMTQITFEVKCDNTICIEMKCTTNEPTIVNLSNSQYFNLAGHHAGQDPLFEHIVTINADKYTPTDEEGVVLGEKKVVGGSAYDLRVPRILGVMIPKMCMGGYNVNYCITQGQEQDMTFHARGIHPGTGRVLEVYSNQPGMQFYTGSLLPDPDKVIQESTGCAGDESAKHEADPESAQELEDENESEGVPRCGYVPLYGKKGTCYKRNGFVCFMPQNYPDAVNHRNFPNSILNPGEEYCHKIQYKFGILLGRYS